MITVDCPWCDGPALVEMMADDAELRCDECCLAVPLALETEVPVARAA
jgi:hypothetical protein